MPVLRTLLLWAHARRDLVVVVIIVTAIVTMILPIPTVLVDFLIALNIGMSILLLMVAFFLRTPVEFSALPAIILISTVFRLSISITTSRLVLVQADAGAIIQTFGEFVIAGNAIVGLVVFLIITVVQFVVITKGAERVAEVAARFTLDAMPGKQMSIDADLRNGDINQAEARRRRRLLERESQLYGAMDGAMKFVKGDAIAGLIIIAVNLIGGIAVGTVQHKLRASEAVHVYSLLTIGDGLISQIPALFVSMAAGTVVTRVTTDGAGNLGSDIIGQIGARPDSLRLAGIIMLGLAFVPGFPTPIFLLLGALFGGIGTGIRLLQKPRGEDVPTEAATAAVPGPAAGLALPKLAVAPVMVIAEPVLCERLRRDGFTELVRAVRQDVADKLGFACPAVGLAPSPDLARHHYRMELNNVPVLTGDVDATGAGSVVTQSLRHVLVRHAAEFLGIQETKRLLAQLEGEYADLVREAQRVAPLQRITDVLRRLLEEQVSIVNLRLILETLAEWGPREQNPSVLAEHLRAAMKRQICHANADSRRVLRGFVLQREAEDVIRSAAHLIEQGGENGLDPTLAIALVDNLTGHVKVARLDAGKPVVVLASKDIRRVVWGVLARSEFSVVVICHQEIAPEYALEPVAVIGLGERTASALREDLPPASTEPSLS